MNAPAPTVRQGDPNLPFRRRIRIVGLDAHTVWGGLEDDFHHFEIRLAHDTTTVTDIAMEALRWPWATCPDAGANLAEEPKVVGGGVYIVGAIGSPAEFDADGKGDLSQER